MHLSSPSDVCNSSKVHANWQSSSKWERTIKLHPSILLSFPLDSSNEKLKVFSPLSYFVKGSIQEYDLENVLPWLSQVSFLIRSLKFSLLCKFALDGASTIRKVKEHYIRSL